MRVSMLALLALAASVHFAHAASDNNGGFDHRAHAVPGGPYHVPDSDSNGKEFVELNGELSHSHYFNPRTGATGKIVKFKWFSGKNVICGQMKCRVSFTLGTTIVRLAVVDNTGDSAEANTQVTVYRGAKPGVRMWFYPGNGWIPDKQSEPVPPYSMTPNRMQISGRASFPQFLIKKKFSVRALGDLEIPFPGTYGFRVGCGGAWCTLWINNKMILTGKNRNISSRPAKYRKGPHKIHLLYRRSSSTAPSPFLIFYWRTPGKSNWGIVPAKSLSHTPSIYRPVVHHVQPRSARVGNVINVHGSSLVNVRRVKIGGNVCAGPVARSQFVLSCVVPGMGGGEKSLSVETDAGTSNSVKITITQPNAPGSGTGAAATGSGPVGYYQRIKFSKSFLKRNGKRFHAPQLTAIALGPDGQFYIGSLNGVVHVIRTDLGTRVTNYCKSNSIGQRRSILGLAFNPAEISRLRLYASTSVLYWGTKKLLPFTKGWHNGQVIALQKSKSCMSKVATIISGLPVSNYDHAVNGISFDHYGALLVTVGGGTNAGVSTPGDPLGGVPDSPLSGAMLQAPISKPGFNGKVTYNQYSKPGVAKKVGGQVFVFAAGLRNSLCHVAHSNGHLYATDNGANAKFGARSAGCNKSKGVLTEPDKLLKLRQNGYYGYANRNRGRFDGRQCTHVSPQFSHGPDRPIATLESSTDGLIEYTANTFGAQLRGDLFASKFAVSGSGKVYRIQLNNNGSVKSRFIIASHSGLTAAMSATGGLIMPRVYQGNIATLMPVEQNPGKIVVTSVNPFRGPKRGGNTITVTGWNLTPPLKVTVGGKPCTNVGNLKGGRSFTCIVPRGSGKVPVIVRRHGKSSKSYGFEYMYMQV